MSNRTRAAAATLTAAACIATGAVAAAPTASAAPTSTTGTTAKWGKWHTVASSPCTKRIGTLRVTARATVQDRYAGKNVQRRLRLVYSVPQYSRGIGPGVVVYPSTASMYRVYPKDGNKRRSISYKADIAKKDGVIEFNALDPHRPVQGTAFVTWAVKSGTVKLPTQASLNCLPRLWANKAAKKEPSGNRGIGGGGSF